MRQYMRWPYGNCARVLVPSEATRQLLIAPKAIRPKDRLWTRGVDTAQFSPAWRSEALRASWRVSRRRARRCSTSAASRARKGCDAAAPCAIACTNSASRIGSSSPATGRCSSELQRRLPDAVFTGTLPHEAVADADGLGRPVRLPEPHRHAGNVVLEAQASGLPVLVSDDGGPRENMIDGETGFVCQRGTRRLGRRARRPAARPGAPPRWRRRARIRATRTWEQALEPLYRTYLDATAEAPRPRRRTPCAPEAHANLTVSSPTTVRGVLCWLVRHPWSAVVRRWN